MIIFVSNFHGTSPFHLVAIPFQSTLACANLRDPHLPAVGAASGALGCGDVSNVGRDLHADALAFLVASLVKGGASAVLSEFFGERRKQLWFQPQLWGVLPYSLALF